MIPKQLLSEILADDYYKQCARKGFDCNGRITFEHAFIYAGKQVQAKWAIIPLCVYHHLGKGLNKELNHYLALSRAELDQVIIEMPKKDWRQLYNYLNSKYGKVND